jgi:hypothetical protein
MPQGAVADVGENHVGAAPADHDLDSSLAIQRFILHELGKPVLLVRDHNPFGLAKMRRHLPVSATR